MQRMPQASTSDSPRESKSEVTANADSVIGSSDTNRRLKHGLGKKLHRFNQWRRRDEESRAESAPSTDAGDSTKDGGKHEPIRRRSVLGRKIPPRWMGKSSPLHAVELRGSTSEEKLKTSSLQPVDTRRRAASEGRAPIVQHGRAPSILRLASHSTCESDGVSEFVPAPHHQRIKRTGTEKGTEGDEVAHYDQQAQQSRSMPGKRRLSKLFDSVSMSSEDREQHEYGQLVQELDSKWILNLSVQFRDHSKNERFFVTYAEHPGSWRRIVVTWNYHNLREGSLEADLVSMPLQREKNIRLYQSLRPSLADIQFFDTVTNLTLRTEDDGNLHIYVSEDHNETVHYPSVRRLAHIDCPRYPESKVIYEEHLAGYVYKVRTNGKMLVKKDIPGPGNIDEFLYEVNALHALQDSSAVVNLEGVVTDNEGKYIKALLISHGSQGTLCDMIYTHRRTDKLPWARRRKWARQMLQGLCDIHEAGYVQGDFTISNIVIDEEDNASVIDFNRRGCPIGWEPPELMQVIQSRQRVVLMIGVKSDLYQLGMCLYALAEQVDEPERRFRESLFNMPSTDVPDWYKRMVLTCLEPQPRDRVSAYDLLRIFDHHLSAELGLESNGTASILGAQSDPSSVADRRYLTGKGRDNRDNLSGIGRVSGTTSPTQSLRALSLEESYFAPSLKRQAKDGSHVDSQGDAGLSSRLSNDPKAYQYAGSISKTSQGSFARRSEPHSSRMVDYVQPDWNFDSCDPPVNRPPLHTDSGFDETVISFVDDADRYIVSYDKPDAFLNRDAQDVSTSHSRDAGTDQS